MLSKEELSDGFEFPAYSSDSSNNGIIGFTNNPEFICDDITPVYLTFGDHTRTVNIAKKSFSVLDNVKVLKPFTSNEKYLLFIISSWKKQIPNLGYARHWKVARNCKIQLPLKEKSLDFSNPCDNVKNIDFDFMESFIREIEAERMRELEEERIRELNAYLLATGLKDYALSAEEEKALEAFKTVQWGEFEIGKVFDVLTSKKRFDANKIEVLDNGKYPYVVRTALNNGIKGYLNESKEYLNDGKSISFGQDTATMFYQEHPYFTGDKIKIVKCKSESFNKLNALYFLTSMNKTFSTFSWGSSSFNVDIINCQKLQLPTKNNKPDYATMETFIKAVEKLVIKDVVLYADSKIKATKNVVKKDFEYKINEDTGLLNVAEK